MSTRIGSAYIDVDADTDKATGSFKKFAAAAAKSIAAVVVGLGALAAGAIKLGTKLQAAGEEAVTNARRITAVGETMGRTGGEAAALTDRLTSLSETMTRQTGVDDDIIQKGQAMLLSFQNVGSSAEEVGGIFDRATAAALDLAASGFGNVEGNAKALGIALNDPIKGISRLTRVGITFTDAEKEKIKAMQESGNLLGAQELILGKLEDRVGGVAAETAKTSDRVRESWDNVVQNIGTKLLPMFDRIGNFLIDTVFPKVEKFGVKAGRVINRMVRAFTKAESIPEGLLAAFSELTGGDGVGSIMETLMGVVQDAFDGLVDWLATGGIESIVQGIIEGRERLFNASLRLFPVILDALLTVVPALLSAITNSVIPGIIQIITEGIPALLATAVTLFTQIVDALVQIIPVLLQTLVDLIPTLVEAILGFVPQLLEAGIGLFTSLIEAVAEILPDLLTAIVNLIPAIVETIVEMAPEILAAGVKAFIELVTSIADVLPDIITAITEMIPDLVTAIIEMAPELLLAGTEAFFAIVQALIDTAPELIDEIVFNLIPDIVDAVGELPGKLFDAGKDAFQGFIEGMQEKIGEIIDTVEGMVEDVVGFFPFSPAKHGPLRRKPPEKAGARLMEMYAEGMSKASRLVSQGAAMSASRAATGFASVQLTGGINLYFSGNPSRADARMAGEAAAAGLIEKLSRARIAQ